MGQQFILFDPHPEPTIEIEPDIESTVPVIEEKVLAETDLPSISETAVEEIPAYEPGSFALQDAPGAETAVASEILEPVNQADIEESISALPVENSEQIALNPEVEPLESVFPVEEITPIEEPENITLPMVEEADAEVDPEPVVVLEEPPVPPEVKLFTSAVAAEKSKHYLDAYTDYCALLELLPEHPSAWMGKGRCAIALSTSQEQRLDEAVVCFKQAQQFGLDQPDEMNSAAHLLSAAVAKHTRDLVPFLVKQLRVEMPAPGFWVTGKARLKAEEAFSDALSARFWDQKLPIINSLWFAWWGLSKDAQVANHVYEVVKALKNTAIAINYQQAVVKTLDPILADIKTALPRYRPPFKIKFETADEEEDQDWIFESAPELTSSDTADAAAEVDLSEQIQVQEEITADAAQSLDAVPVVQEEQVDEPTLSASPVQIEPDVVPIPAGEEEHVEQPAETAPAAAVIEPVENLSLEEPPPGQESIAVDEKTPVDALALEEQKRFRQAFAAYTQALETDPENAALWMARGRCAAWASTADDQLLEEAVSAYKKALEIGVSDADDLRNAAYQLSSATLAYTQDLVMALAENTRLALPAPKTNLFSRALGLDRKQARAAFSEAFSNKFWDLKLPILNSLWFCWWGLSQDPIVVDQIYAVIKTLRDAGITANYEEAVIHTLEPILSDINAKFPEYKPPLKLDIEFAEEPVVIEENVMIEEPVQAQESVQIDESIQPEETVQPEESVQVEEPIQTEAPSQEETIVQVEEPQQPEVTVQIEEPNPIEAPVQVVESAQLEESIIQAEEPIQVEAPVQVEETVQIVNPAPVESGIVEAPQDEISETIPVDNEVHAELPLSAQKPSRSRKKSRSKKQSAKNQDETISMESSPLPEETIPVEKKRTPHQVTPGEAISMAAARTAEEARHFQQAVRSYDEVLDSNPDHAAAWLGKGRCIAWLSNPDQERLEEALSCLKKALEIGIADANELKLSASRLGAATLIYTRALVAALSQKYGIEQPGARNGVFGRIFGGSKVDEATTIRLSEEFWGLTMPIFNSLFFCWRLSNEMEIANDIYDTINTLKDTGIARNYQEAFIETFNPVLGEIRVRFPKYKPPK
jgi:tetratricopeptide (TPR) repeat protein